MPEGNNLISLVEPAVKAGMVASSYVMPKLEPAVAPITGPIDKFLGEQHSRFKDNKIEHNPDLPMILNVLRNLPNAIGKELTGPDNFVSNVHKGVTSEDPTDNLTGAVELGMAALPARHLLKSLKHLIK